MKDPTAKAINLESLAGLGDHQVVLEGEALTAPFSQTSCLWYDWIHRRSGAPAEEGFGYGDGRGGLIVVRSSHGALEIDSGRLQLYLAPAFEGKIIVDEEEAEVTEYCLLPGHSYHARVETRSSILPGPRLLPFLPPFLPRRRSIRLLALSDVPFVKGVPGRPLVPSLRGWCCGQR